MSFLTFLSAVTYTAMCIQYMYIQHIFPCDQCKDTGIWGIISASDASDTMLLCQALICLEDFALKSLGPFLHLVPGAAPQFCARAAKEAVLYSKKVELSYLYGNQTSTPLPSHSARRNTSCTWHREGRGATKYKLPCVSLKCPKQCHINT